MKKFIPELQIIYYELHKH